MRSWNPPATARRRVLGILLGLLALALLAWPRPVAAQAITVTPSNPCFETDENLTRREGDTSRGISNQPVISRSGTRVAFWSTNDLAGDFNRDGNIEIYVQDLGGTQEIVQITESSGSILGGFNLAPSIDAAGDRVVFFSDRDQDSNQPGKNSDGNFEIFMAVRQANGTWPIRQLTDTRGSANLFPSINGPGNRIAFVSDDANLDTQRRRTNPDRNFELFLAELLPNGTIDIRQLTDTQGVTNDRPSINATGNRIVYSVTSGQTTQLFAWDEGRSTPTLLAGDGGADQAAINADGTRSVYISPNGAEVILHELSADGSENRSEPIMRASTGTTYRNPSISDDGNRIVFVAESTVLADPNNPSGPSERLIEVLLYDHRFRQAVVISQLGDGTGEQPVISGDGTRILFVGSRSVGGLTDAADSDIYAKQCPQANLRITLTSPVPATIVAGLDLTYTFRVTNTGPSEAQNVFVESDLTTLPGLPDARIQREFVGCSDAVVSAGILRCRLSNVLPVGGAANFSVIYRTPDDSALGPIVSRFRTAADVVDLGGLNDSGRITTTVTEQAALALSAVADRSIILAGSQEILTYSLRITNTGPSQARSTVLTNTLPTGSQFVTATVLSAGGGSVSCPSAPTGNLLVCELGNLPVNSQNPVRLNVQIRALASAPPLFTYAASVRSATGELNLSNNDAQITTTVDLAADMQARISASPAFPAPVNAGEFLTYTVVFTNAGPALATGARVTDTLPANMRFSADASSPGVACSANPGLTQVTCNASANMAVGQVLTARYVVRVLPTSQPGEIVNTARVSSNLRDPNETNNETNPVVTTLVTLLADLHLTKRVSKTDPNVGELITYTVVVSNAGPSQAYSVVVTDQLAVGQLSYISHVQTTGLYTPSVGIWNIGDLPVGNVVTLTVAVTPTQVGAGQLVTNTAVVKGTQPDVDPPDGLPNSASVTIVPQFADFALTKAAPPFDILAGERLTYTLRVTNTGPTVARAVQLIDTLQVGVNFVEAPNCSRLGVTVTCSLGDMTVGQSLTRTIVITHTKSENVANSVTVTSTTPGFKPTELLDVAIKPNVPHVLAFLAQPPITATAGAPITPSVVISDAFNNLVNEGVGAGDRIRLTPFTNPTCTNVNEDDEADPDALFNKQIAAVAGVATFNGLNYTKAQTIYLLAEDIDFGGVLTACSTPITILPAQTQQLALISASQVVTAGIVSLPLEVERRDRFGNANTNDANLLLSLSSTSTTTVPFLLPIGLTPTTNVTITQGVSRTTFLYTDTVQGVYTVTVTGTGIITPATQAITVTAAPADRLAIIPPSAPITAGVTSALFTVQRFDPFGNLNSTDGNVVVGLSSTSTGTVTFTTAAFVPTTVVTISTGSNATSFAYRDTLAGIHTVSVTDTAQVLSGDAVSVTVAPAPATRLVFTSDPYTIPAGFRTESITVARQDDFGNFNSDAVSVTVNLTSTSAGAPGYPSLFFDGEGVAVTSVTIEEGSIDTTFTYSDTLAGVHALWASDADLDGLLAASQPITVTPAGTQRVEFLSAAQVVTAGVVSGPYELVRLDLYGNANSNDADLPLDLFSDSDSELFLLPSVELTPTTRVTITQGVSRTTFLYTDTVQGVYTIDVDAPEPIVGASQTVTVTAAPATKLVYTTAPPTVTAGITSTVFTVQRRDPFNNPNFTDPSVVVTLTSTSAGPTFFYAEETGPVVQSVTISPTNATVDFYYRDVRAGTHDVIAGYLGALEPATTTVTVEPGPAATLVFVTPSRTITAGVPSELITLEVRDEFANVVTPTTPSQVTAVLTSTSIVSSTFYAAESDSVITDLVFDGESRQSFRYRDEKAGVHALSAAAPGLTNTPQAITVTADVATHVTFVTDPHVIKAGTPSDPIRFERRDQYGNPNSTDDPVRFDLTTSNPGTGAFLPENTLTPITQVTITTGITQASFHYSDTIAGAVVITVADVAGDPLPAIAQTHEITGNAAVRLVITGTTPQTAGTAQTITIDALDEFDNLSPLFHGPVDLVFGGAQDARDGSKPTVDDVIFGVQTPITFTIGRATAEMTLFRAGQTVITATDGEIVATGGDALTVTVAPTNTHFVRAETANVFGNGVVVPSQTVTAGQSVTLWAVSRDLYLNPVGTENADWQIQATGGVTVTDLAPLAGDVVTFTGRLTGTAVITPEVTGFVSVGSGLLTVVPGAATQVRVETAPGDAGVLVPTQEISSGQSITVYAVTRDVFGNYVGDVSASWSITQATGGVNNANLSPAPLTSGTFKVFTAAQTGTGRIQATSASLAVVPSGVLTVTAGNAAYLQVTTTTPITTAGSPRVFTVRAFDANNNLATGYSGEKELVFGGPQPSTRPVISPTVTNQVPVTVTFGQPLTVTFAGGVSQPITALLYLSQTASVNVTDTLQVTSIPTGTLAVTTTATSTTVPHRYTILAATTNLTAGEQVALTIRADDPYGNLVHGYAGNNIDLLFLSDPDATAQTTVSIPATVRRSGSGAEVNFGASTALNFSGGIATVSGNTNGWMNIRKAGTFTITTRRTISPTYASGDDGALHVNVAPTPTQTVSLALPPVIRVAQVIGPSALLTVTDSFSNPVPLDTALRPVTFTMYASDGVTPLDVNGTLTFSDSVTTYMNVLQNAGIFANGVIDLVALNMAWTGTTANGARLLAEIPRIGGGVITRTVQIDILPGDPVEVGVQGALGGGDPQDLLGTIEVGAPISLSLNLRDAAGNLSDYTGPITLTFGGANDATVVDANGAVRSFGTDTVVMFSNGRSTVSSGHNGVLRINETGTFLNISAAAPNLNPYSGLTIQSVVAATPAQVAIQGTTGSDLLTSTLTVAAGTPISLSLQLFGAYDNPINWDGQVAFTFAGAPPSVNPLPPDAAVVDSIGAAKGFGESTTLNFTAGTSTVSGGNNGVLRLYQAGVYTITASNVSLTPRSQLVVTVLAGPPSLVDIEGNVGADDPASSLSVMAGEPVSLTLRLYDVYGNPSVSNDPVDFTFATDPATNATVVDNGGTAQTVGASTTITFSGGVSTVADGDNGLLQITEVGVFTLTATGPGITTRNELGVTVTPGVLETLAFNLDAGPQYAGLPVTGTNTLTALDAYGNTTTVNDPVTVTVTSSPTATVVFNGFGANNVLEPEDFDDGVADLTDLGMVYTGLATGLPGNVELLATSQTGKTGTGALTMLAGPLETLDFNLDAGPQYAGLPVTGVNTLTALDAYGNTITDYDQRSNPVTVTVSTAPAGTLVFAGSLNNDDVLEPGDFFGGIANLTALTMTYEGPAGSVVLTATSQTGKTGTGALTVLAGDLAVLELSSDDPNVVAGESFTPTLRAWDAYGNLRAGYTGPLDLVFSGAAQSGGYEPHVVVGPITYTFGVATPVEFVAGVAAPDVRLFQAATDVPLKVEVAGSPDISATLPVTVTHGGVESFVVSFTSPQDSGVAFTGSNTVEAVDAYGNTVLDFAANVEIVPQAPLTGTITGLDTPGNIIPGTEFSTGSGIATLTTIVYTTENPGESGVLRAQLVGDTNRYGDSDPITFNAGP